jgi:hypothetical protein
MAGDGVDGGRRGSRNGALLGRAPGGPSAEVGRRAACPADRRGIVGERSAARVAAAYVGAAGAPWRQSRRRWPIAQLRGVLVALPGRLPDLGGDRRLRLARRKRRWDDYSGIPIRELAPTRPLPA